MRSHKEDNSNERMLKLIVGDSANAAGNNRIVLQEAGVSQDKADQIVNLLIEAGKFQTQAVNLRDPEGKLVEQGLKDEAAAAKERAAREKSQANAGVPKPATKKTSK